MERETPSPIISPPDPLPLLWPMADLIQVPVTALSPALPLAGTSDSRSACGDITRRCRHPFQHGLRRADLHAEQTLSQI